MLGFGRSRAQLTASGAGLFGKIAVAGDFIQTPSDNATVHSLREWVDLAIESAAGQGEQFKAAFDDGSDLRVFVFRPPEALKTGQLAVGLFRPSRDSVGRRYPLVGYSLLPQKVLQGRAHLLPLLVGDFLESLSGALDRAAAGDAANALSSVAAVVPPVLDVDAAAQDYDEWAQSSPLFSAWQATFGSPLLGVAANALHIVHAALAPFGGAEPVPSRVGVRLPLGFAGSGAVAFWFDLVGRIARYRRVVPIAFWTPTEGGDAVIQLGQAPPAVFSELWLPDANSESTCDLTASATVDGAEMLERLPPRWAEVLSRPNSTVSELLSVLPDS